MFADPGQLSRTTAALIRHGCTGRVIQETLF